MAHHTSSPSVAVAVAWYALLLRAYPVSFRRQYGTQMTEVFEDRCGSARRRHGRSAVAASCLAAVGEVLVNASKEHIGALRRTRHTTTPQPRKSSARIAEAALTDVRFALRTFAKNPIFAVVAMLTLCLGIGANSAIFTVVNGVLLRPLPYDRPEDLVAVAHTAPGLGYSRLPQAPATYLTYRDENRVFEAFGAWSRSRVSVTGSGDPELVDAVWITEDVLSALRVQPSIGHGFATATMADVPGGVILSHGYWQRRFGGDAAVIGRTVQLNLVSWEIVGVMPEDFRFLHYEPSLYLPNYIPADAGSIRSFDYQGIARLRPGVSLDEANRDVARMIPLTAEFPWATAADLDEWRFGPDVHPLKADVVGDVGTVLWVLFGMFGLVLLIACANVANLFFVRAEARQREIAVRTAMGASRGRIARQFLAESVVLGLFAGVAGLGLAQVGVRLLVHLAPANLPRLDEITIDPAVLLFTVGVSLFAGLVFGLFPVLHYGNPNVVTALKEGGRGSSVGRQTHRLRTALAVTQLALALVLLIGSGLMIRSFRALKSVDPGFDRPQEVLTLRLAIPRREILRGQEGAVPITEQILRRLAEVPGVTSVGAASGLPMEGATNTNSIQVEDFPIDGSQAMPVRYYKAIAGDYFAAMEIPLLAGRSITWDDIYQRRPVGVVTENFAREYWGNPALALGKRIRHNATDAWREIVGVVGNVHDRGVDEDAPSVMYWPMAVENFAGFDLWVRRSMSYVIRTARPNPSSLLPEVRQAVWSVNPNLPLANVRTLDDLVAGSLSRTSFTLVMLGIAATVAVFLGTVGIYGVISYIVAQRTKEIGVRMALGAQQSDVRRMVLRHGAAIGAGGVIIGLAAAVGLTRVMSALLFGVRPADPVTYAAGAASVAAVSLLACYIPARRAAAVDPLEALRWE
jgi:predicted permease